MTYKIRPVTRSESLGKMCLARIKLKLRPAAGRTTSFETKRGGIPAVVFRRFWNQNFFLPKTKHLGTDEFYFET